MIIGVTGGVGAGKSTVMEMISEYSFANIIDTDSFAKEIMDQDEQVKKKLTQIFGENILDKGGHILYGNLADKVFGTDRLTLLNEIVHPVVIEKIRELTNDCKQVWFIESAILTKTGLLDLCDEVWLIEAEESTRIKRVIESRGYSRKRAEAMVSSQCDAYSYDFEQIIHNNEYYRTKEYLKKLFKEKFKKELDK